MNLIGSFIDAWDEVTVHRARVVLSLVGVVLAVFAMTAVTAAGMIFKQIMQQSFERYTGRDTTITMNVTSMDGTTPEGGVTAFYDSVVTRYGVRYASRAVQTGTDLNVQGTALQVMVVGADPDYAVIHRMTPSNGRWLRAGDAAGMAPAVVVNTKLLTDLGYPERPTPFAADLPLSSGSQRVIVVGVLSQDEWGDSMWVLNDDLKSMVPSANPEQGTLELWVPPDRAEQMAREITALGASQNLSVNAQAQTDQGLGVVLTGLQVLIFAISLFALFLGALGVLNVGVVTVRQRVREIGIRRALGASSGRIFAAVMLESVLATALAGLLGIALAIALVNSFPYQILPQELQVTEDVPFPVAAAFQAFVTVTIIGALVGLIPATIAVRSRVIDAIRY